MKKLLWISFGLSIVLSGCSSNHPCRGSNNVKGCGTVVHAQVPAVRIPAVVMPSGDCGGDCYAPRVRSRSNYVEPVMSEYPINRRDSIYPKTYDTFCSPRM